MRKQAEFIARQLNDHRDSKRGVRQGTFHTWSEPHILEALDKAVSYLFSIRPDEFSVLKEIALKEASCYFQIPCGNVLDILGIGECNNVSFQENQNSNNLIPLLGNRCGIEVDSETQSYTIERSGKGIFTSSSPIPAGVTITYVCAEKPSTDEVEQSLLDKHDTLITSFALWWLLLTDNESRTNLERVQLYYQMVKDYVELTLLLEFSLNEDDYKYGRRRVND